MQLPAGLNPRSVKLGAGWRALAHPAQRIERALGFLKEQRLTYTLRPPLTDEHVADAFLFETKRGFCEHFAAAFVVLMRAAGVPARVVTGYQGGEKNPVDGTWVIRQSDAHAWAEVWLAERGWVRIDPTATAAPARIEADLAAALMSLGGIRGFEVGMGFEASKRKGSQVNDVMYKDSSGKLRFKTNNAGGLLGGITNGEDLVVRIAIKPTSSISKVQHTVDKYGNPVELKVKGRHDPCLCPRAVPIAEAMVNLVLADHLLMSRLAKI
jgi:hypothetical protein